MKVLISNDSMTAHYYQHLGIGRAFDFSGHKAVLWDKNGKSAHDIFFEYEPDLFIGQAYNLDRALIKCIQSRPKLRVVLKGGDWGSFYDDWDEQKHKKYPILMASKQEKENVMRLRDSGNLDYLFVHYHPDYIEQTHGHWMKENIMVISFMNAADLFDYTNGQYKEEFASDVAFVGGRWGYKSITLDRWLLPLCNPLSERKVNVKIFGNQDWGVPQYYGKLPPGISKHIFSSAIICPNISEPHSQDFGFDIIERPFKLMSNKCFVISDYVDGLRDLYSDQELVLARTPEEFINTVYFYLDNPDKRHTFRLNGYKKTIKEHTYFDRIVHLCNKLNLSTKAILEAKEKVVKEFQL